MSNQLPEYRNLVGGAAVDAVEGGTRDVLSPATGKPIGRVPEGTDADVERAVGAASEAFPAWRGATPAARAQVLLDHLAEQLCRVTDTGRKVALVSSGAVAAGIGRLGLKGRPDNLPHLQAAAAVGQSHLMRCYDEGMRKRGRNAAQLLLTHEDFDGRGRYLNMRNTLLV